MRTWIITGPIGSGKSAVTQILADQGAAVLDADRLGHQILRLPPIVEKIGLMFGADCLEHGQVNRNMLGALVFSDSEAMDKLNGLVHPPLIELLMAQWEILAHEGKHELAVLEAAVYFLWPPLDFPHRVVAVVSQDELRRRRLQESRGLSDADILNRMKAQASWEEFWPQADVLLENNGTLEELQQAVQSLLLKHHP